MLMSLVVIFLSWPPGLCLFVFISASFLDLCLPVTQLSLSNQSVGLLLTTMAGHDGLVLVVVVVLVLIKVLLSIIRFVGHLACHSDTKDEFSENKTLNQILSTVCLL